MEHVGIIGTGIAGMGLAYFLHKSFAVTLFDKAEYIGGHTNTIFIDDENQSIPIDTGFMVFNDKNYPNLCRLFTRLGIRTQKTCMSLSVRHGPSSLEYSCPGLSRLFSQRKNAFNPRFIKVLMKIYSFHKDALAILDNPQYDYWTVNDLLEKKQYGADFIQKYLIPISAAVWFASFEQMRNMPAKTLLRFFYNHGFLGLQTQCQWYTVTGGSETYKRVLIQPFRSRIRLKQNISSVSVRNGRAVVLHQDGRQEEFDKLVFACPADQALALLAEPTELQKNLLAAFQYHKNNILLHCDERLMPELRHVWSSWNCKIEADGTGKMRPTTIYWLNRLQKLPTKKNFFVSLNDPGLVNPDKILRRITYFHPIFDQTAIAAQEHLPKLNRSSQPLYFCGSYFRYGFHEDALASAISLASLLLGRDPW